MELDWESLFPWIESRAGVAYNCDNDLNDLDGDSIFVDPYGWYIDYLNILDHLRDITTVIKDYSDEIPDDFGSETDVLKFVNEYFTSRFLTIVNGIESKLLMTQTPLRSMSELNTICETLHEYVEIFINEDLADIQNQELIDKYNEENDNILTETFNVHQADCEKIYQIIESIRAKYDEDEE